MISNQSFYVYTCGLNMHRARKSDKYFGILLYYYFFQSHCWKLGTKENKKSIEVLGPILFLLNKRIYSQLSYMFKKYLVSKLI